MVSFILGRSTMGIRGDSRSGTVGDLVGDLACLSIYILSLDLFQETHWTYNIDTAVPRHCNDGIEGTEVHADNWTRKVS
jgi:hypothetical protein